MKFLTEYWKGKNVGFEIHLDEIATPTLQLLPSPDSETNVHSDQGPTTTAHTNAGVLDYSPCVQIPTDLNIHNNSKVSPTFEWWKDIVLCTSCRRIKLDENVSCTKLVRDGKWIASGNYSNVYRVKINDSSRDYYALKHIHFGNDEMGDIKRRAQLEVKLLSQLQKPSNENSQYIIPLKGVQQTDTDMFILMEYIPSGRSIAELYRRKQLNESMIRRYTLQLLLATQYIHSMNILHRDIHGGNILIDNHNDHIQLIDFGHACRVDCFNEYRFYGSSMWIAPEVITDPRRYSTQADVWSIGCVVLEMYQGCPYPRFKRLSDKQMIRFIATKRNVLPEIPSGISSEGRQFLERIFERDPSQRATISELLEMDYVKNCCTTTTGSCS